MTLAQLLTGEPYRNMDIDDLTIVINFDLDFQDYLLLQGETAKDKAHVIKMYFDCLDD